MMKVREETLRHIAEVRANIGIVVEQLDNRRMHHDQSKLNSPEAEIFEVYTPKLKGTTYGIDEYKQYLKEMKVALDHHYAVNRHHPEHFGPNGINDMTLIDLIEMLCDWLAATKRHADGDIYKSIEINKARFGYSGQLARIFENTVKELVK